MLIVPICTPDSMFVLRKEDDYSFGKKFLVTVWSAGSGKIRMTVWGSRLNDDSGFLRG